VAISNARLVHVDDQQVRFRTRDGKHATLSPEIFIGRFLLHVLPRRFVKIRHYGLMASSHATTSLETARALLESPATPRTPATASTPATAPLPESLDWRTRLAQLTGIDLSICPHCGGPRVREPISRASTTRSADTS
jgi:hypothetical protein